MNSFDIAAILIAIAAVSGYVNHRFLKLPATSGMLAVAIVSSALVVVVDALAPDLALRAAVARFLNRIDFNETLMHGMLCFLLFAGALHLDLGGLLEQKWSIAGLSVISVLVSTGIVGVLSWVAFDRLGLHVPLLLCLTFGALISPTDPIAVMGLLKELKAPRSLESQIAGESLFNDGIGVVCFFALLSLIDQPAASATEHVAPGATTLTLFFVREVGGGALLGLGLGYIAYRAMKSIDDHPLELLITLALAMFLYATSFWIHVSGPIAVVIAGLLIGNPGRRFAMSDRTREHVDAFWSMIDEILNAVLFLLLGLEVFALPAGAGALLASLIVIPIALVARLVSVAVPLAAMRLRGPLAKGLVPVLTWSGLRGGISVAMALSLPRFEAKDLLLACTYAVVLFSVFVQGLTVRRVLTFYDIGGSSGAR